MLAILGPADAEKGRLERAEAVGDEEGLADSLGRQRDTAADTGVGQVAAHPLARRDGGDQPFQGRAHAAAGHGGVGPEGMSDHPDMSEVEFAAQSFLRRVPFRRSVDGEADVAGPGHHLVGIMDHGLEVLLQPESLRHALPVAADVLQAEHGVAVGCEVLRLSKVSVPVATGATQSTGTAAGHGAPVAGI